MKKCECSDGVSVVQANQCGACTACCILYCLPELNKPARTPCRHLCETGCSIHDHARSPICTDFECAYLRYPWDIDLRPDKCGVIFNFTGFCDYWRIGQPASVPRVPNKDRPRWWNADCITPEAFQSPTPSVVEFITHEVKRNGAVTFMCTEDGWTRVALFGSTASCGKTRLSYPNDNVYNPTFPNDVNIVALTIDTVDAGQSVVKAVDPEDLLS
jgi:hypothetical protein